MSEKEVRVSESESEKEVWNSVRTQAGTSYTLLAQYEEKDNELLQSLVTIDETRVNYFTPETKRALKQWRHRSSPK